uniref:Bestrophin homolog n=1 Tax=Glossina austeni TaxID=7395 RepID=A0A1A9V3L9_GLOAU
MTIYYAAEVATCRGFGCFPKLLLRWRASIYKLLWVDLCSPEERVSLIPVIFVLGFFVSLAVQRWWAQYLTLPWPDSTAVYVSALVTGQDERGRLMRRTIMRYVCLSLTLVMTMIAPRVKRRFPKLEYIKDAGLLTENEMKIFKSMIEKFGYQHTYWVPIVWATSIVTRARKEGRVRDDASLRSLIDTLNGFRGMLMVLLFYDTISIPLVYTQVVTIAVYTFFVATVLGRQWTPKGDTDGVYNLVDLFCPIISCLEFLFFMGWLKVAESLISPFGDDDDDFELNWLIDRNIQVAYLIVDEMHHDHPELVRDQYWDEIFPMKIPLAHDVEQGKAHVRFEEPPMHSTAKIYTSRHPSIESFTTLGRGGSHGTIYSEHLFGITSAIKKFANVGDRRSISDIPRSSSSFSIDKKVGYEALEGEDEEDSNIEGISSQSTNWERFPSVDLFEELRRLRSNEKRERQKKNFAFLPYEGLSSQQQTQEQQESQLLLKHEQRSQRPKKRLAAEPRSSPALRPSQKQQQPLLQSEDEQAEQHQRDSLQPPKQLKWQDPPTLEDEGPIQQGDEAQTEKNLKESEDDQELKRDEIEHQEKGQDDPEAAEEEKSETTQAEKEEELPEEEQDKSEEEEEKEEEEGNDKTQRP